MSNESAQKTLYLGKLDEILDTWIEAFAKGSLKASKSEES